MKGSSWSQSSGFIRIAFISGFLCHLASTALGQLTISVSRQGVQIDFRDIKFGQFQTRTISLAPGDTYIIRCEVGNIGTFSQHPWTKDGSNVAMMSFDDVSGSNPQVFYDETKSTRRDLYLYKFNSALSGEYACHRNEESKTVAIAASNPSITLEEIYFEERDQRSGEITVPFILFGNPVPHKNNISWFFNGSPLDENALKITNLYSTTKSYIFAISQFEREQSGLYTAVVTTSAGTSNDSFTLQVLSSPEVSFTSDCNCLSNGEIIVSSNSNFTLSCIDTNANPLPTFTWFKDGEQDPQDLLLTSNHITIQSLSSTESRLIFNNILPEHGGMYYCKSNNTEQRETKSVTVNVKFAPLVSAITPPSIAVPVGQQMQLLVEYRGGFPEPEITWSHHNGINNVTVSENDRTEQHGLFGINLTISDVSVSDKGTYTLEVSNYEGTVMLEFDVTILVPPNLIRLSSLTTYGSVGGSATFMVGMVNDHPNVTEDELEWSGNFVPSTQKGTFENEVAVLELTKLKLSDSGNVTLTVRHQGGTVQLVYKLIVLSQPNAPSPVHVRLNGSCLLDVSWEISDPQSMTASTDEVKLEQRTCSYDDTTCVKKWRHLMVYPSDIISTRVFLLPNSDYSFRMTSCSNLVGCGNPEIVQQKVNTNVQGLILSSSSVNVNSVNSSSLKIAWNDFIQSSNCYELVQYEAQCWNTKDRDNVETKFVSKEAVSVVLTNLESDSEYNCTVNPLYNDLLGNKAQIDPLSVYVIGYTYPAKIASVGIDFALYQIAINTITLDLSLSPFIKINISHIHICILRLGADFSIPLLESPDRLYHSLNDFSTYQLVHSQNNQTQYKPYITAEFEARHIPSTFTIGRDDDDVSGHGNYSNGPLKPSDYYTVFIRSYARSQFGKQYAVFTSSEFSSPVKLMPAPATTNSSKDIPIISLSFSTVLFGVILVIVLGVVTSLCIRRKVRRKNSNAMKTVSRINMEACPAYELHSTMKQGTLNNYEFVPSSYPPLSSDYAYEYPDT